MIDLERGDGVCGRAWCCLGAEEHKESGHRGPLGGDADGITSPARMGKRVGASSVQPGVVGSGSWSLGLSVVGYSRGEESNLDHGADCWEAGARMILGG